MIDHPVQRFFKYLISALTDPITGGLSSTRLSGLACVASGCVLAFLHPGEAATVAALLGGGGVAFFSRTKTDTA